MFVDFPGSGKWIERQSAIHRTPADARRKFASHIFPRAWPPQYLDKLPFPPTQLQSHRKEICEYCFYGGPDKTTPLIEIPVPNVALHSSFSPSPTAIQASTGQSYSTVTVLTREIADYPLPGATAEVWTDDPETIVEPAQRTSDQQGIARFRVHSPRAGQKALHARVNGVELPAQGLLIIVPLGPHPPSSTAQIPPLKLGVPAKIVVSVRDKFGNLVTAPTTAAAQVQETGQSSPTSLAAQQEPDGTWAATFTPSVIGPCQIGIFVNATHIGGSPFIRVTTILEHDSPRLRFEATAIQDWRQSPRKVRRHGFSRCS